MKNLILVVKKIAQNCHQLPPPPLLKSMAPFSTQSNLKFALLLICINKICEDVLFSSFLF